MGYGLLGLVLGLAIGIMVGAMVTLRNVRLREEANKNREIGLKNVSALSGMQRYGEIARVVPLEHLPYDTIAVSRKLFQELSEQGDIVKKKTQSSDEVPSE